MLTQTNGAILAQIVDMYKKAIEQVDQKATLE